MKIEGELFNTTENAGRIFLFYQKVATITAHYLPFSLSLIKSKDSSIPRSTFYPILDIYFYIEGLRLDSNRLPIKYQ